jgi:hypothetical protein
MLTRQIRTSLWVGAALLALSGQVRADHHGAGADCGGGGPGPVGAGPAFRTITVNEWVPETYQTTRTTYRTEYVNQTYTAYRQECVPEKRIRTFTVNKMVTECVEQPCTNWVCKPCVETRTCYKRVVTCVPVTCTVRKCVDRGHWECREVPCREGFLTRLRKSCKSDCCEPCPPPTRMEKVWVPCKVWVECPVTRMERRVECVPYTTQVTVNKMVAVHSVRKVNVCKCVPQVCTQEYTCLVSRCVPYTATRCVARCVPVCEKVTCTRLVCRPVQKCVPVTECCAPAAPCCEPIGCCNRKRFGLFGR